MKMFDLVVIGSGPAGEKAAVKAAYFGKKVAIIEKCREVGGAGTNTGTLPSKTLKETAVYYSDKNEKGLYGVDHVFESKPSVTHFLYRQAIVCNEVEEEIRENLTIHKVELFYGKAVFESKNKVKVTGGREEVIYGKHIIIATGSYPFHPENIPFDKERVHDSDSILQIKRLPKSICIIGAGVIGCEYATIFGNMGINVYLINSKKNILPFLDLEVSNELVRVMKKNKIEVICEKDIDSIDVPPNNDELIKISLSTEEMISVDMVLYAAGRSGSTEGLELEKIGIKTGKRQTIVVNSKYQSSISNIYAVGDVIGFPSLASTSMDQGRVAVSHIYKTKDIDSLPKLFPYGIYTIPEISMVGTTEEEARKNKINFCTGHAHHKNTHRGRIKGVKDGFIKIVFEKDSLVIIGIHLIGPLSSEIIHYGLTIVENKKTLHEVISVVFNYPTFHDLYKYACYDGLGNLSGHKIKKS